MKPRLFPLFVLGLAATLAAAPLDLALGRAGSTAMPTPSPRLAPAARPVPPARRPPVPGLDAVSRRLFAEIGQAGEAMASETLARWIAASRADAVRAGVRPMPEAMRARLAPHFPAALLDKVRYRVGIGTDTSLQTHAFQGNAIAITLGEVVLFRHARDAAGNAELWLHELHHVRQYERWGLRGFARRYARDHHAVEAEARTDSARISVRWRGTNAEAGAAAAGTGAGLR